MSEANGAARPVAASLAGMRVALLEARLASEAAALVRRFGGIPVSAPALREQPLACPEVAAFLDVLSAGGLACVVLQTGVGVRALFDEARRLGREDELRLGLGQLELVSRGPKPAAALLARGVRPTVSVDSPFTTRELVAALVRLPLTDAGVGLVHHGERNEPLAAALRERGARLHELMVYEWLLPEDTAPLRALVDTLLAGGVDAVAFTTQIQVRHLFEVAGSDRQEALAEALRRVVTGAVGPTCAEALRARGVSDLVVPDNPKLGPLFAALATRLAERRNTAGEGLRGART